ncbi:SCO3242 family prenyltransferase [Streptomyces sp. NRRL F-2799]|uniref:SCO3242 family prenyltransferase n=1 Tax=Streptomyces sp. NRRL F-2799 TaxID=1463844 RepID=UPI0004C56074|nr:UbiA family prenyltransferase [Streptomyces sp. NRRL F-2799]
MTGEGRGGVSAWAELLRLPALFTVPGDVLAGAATVPGRPGPRTLWAISSSLCLYEAGMALNDWADRAEDAAERPHRPLPSGRIRPTAALTAACVLTATGLALAARAGRPALAVAAPLAATVWAYDLGLKRTPAGPAAMATARALDLLLGAATVSGGVRPALSSAALLGTHTLALTTVSRHETQGGAPLTALTALAVTGALAFGLGGGSVPGQVPLGARQVSASGHGPAHPLRVSLAVAYAATAVRPYLHAALNPSPPLTQKAVGGGIRATIPLQAVLSARAGAPVSALITAALAPLAARFAKKVSVT